MYQFTTEEQFNADSLAITVKIWQEHKNEIMQKIIDLANDFIRPFNAVETINNQKPVNAQVIPGYLEAAKTDPYLQTIWEGVRHEQITDGIFDPWLAYPEYANFVSENGNGDNEVVFISSIWQAVLTFENWEMYQELIALYKGIDVNGL